METLFIKVNEKQYGPLTLDELNALINEGAFTSEDLVWNEESDKWVSAKTFSTLKHFFSPDGEELYSQNKLYAFASGKGGVGKSVLVASIGVGLASMGSEVILVDADLGGANLHTCMGLLEPKYSFFDFYTLQKETLNDIVLETPVENLRMISGACGTLGIANPKYYQKKRFIRELRNLRADHIIMDLSAGSSYNVIDFFLLADESFVIISPEPTAVHEAFNFLKVCLFRKLNRTLKDHPKALEILAKHEVNRPGKIWVTVPDLLEEIAKVEPEAVSIMNSVLSSFHPKLILNMVQNHEDIKEGMAIQSAAMELLSLRVEYLGYISYDPIVRDSVKSLKPFLLYDPKSKASQDLAALIRVKLLGKKGIKEIFERHKWRNKLISFSQKYPHMDLIKNAPICSVKCFYWGNCEYQDGGHPCRVRHLEPAYKE
jgi:flagellar biosynthesis protein FlhG